MRQRTVHVDGADLHAQVGQMVVLIENAYECHRESARREVVPAPHPDEGVDEWFDREDGTEDDPAPYELIGDGHPCGAHEGAVYTVTIVEAPGRPDLVGTYREWD